MSGFVELSFPEAFRSSEESKPKVKPLI